MAAAFLRRSLGTAAVAALTTAFAPMAVSLVAPTAAFAAGAPAIDNSKSAPEPNGALTGTGEDITAVFDQAITGTDGKSSGPCQDTAGAKQCAFVLYEVNADGSRGLRLPGETSFGSSGNPVTGVQDTVDFNPDFSLVNGGTYEAVVHVFGTKSDGSANTSAQTDLDYKVYITNAPPSNLHAPAFANTQNAAAFPLSGVAAPGLTVSVDVSNPMDQAGTGRFDATADVVVSPCSTAPACPWTAKVDLSGPEWPSSASNVDWSASVQDANGDPSSGISADTTDYPSARFTIDFSAPDIPSSNPTPKLTQDTTTHSASVSVNGAEADNSNNSDVGSYLVTVTDPEGNTVKQTFPSTGNDLPAKSVDVTTLDDGQLTVLIQAVDTHGNVSDAKACPTTPPGGACDEYADSGLVKSVGLVPNLGTSVITAGGNDTTFTTAEQQSVPTPTKVSVAFTQTIKESWADCCTTSGPVTHDSSMCVASPNGNCLVSGTPTVSSDHRSISIKVGSKLPDGKYTVLVHTYSAGNCDDRTPANMATYSGCPASGQYNDLVRIPGTGTPGTPFTFTVDNTPPTVTITQVTNPITADNETGVTVSGDVSKSVATVSVLYTSSGKSPSKRLVQGSITQPSDPSATTATYQAGPADLSTFPDGPVTVKVTAKTGSGLQDTVTKTISMQAHLSTLSEFTNHRLVTAGHAIKISGHLSDENGAPIANATITIRPRFDSGKLGHAAAAVTNSEGAYSQPFVPKHNATYVATYKGAPTHDGVTVKTARTKVRSAVTLHGKSHQGTTVRVSGKVSPKKAGKTVLIYDGSKLVGRAHLNHKSRFHATLVLPPGKARLVAKIHKTKGNLAGRSHVLVVTVA